MKPAVFGNGKLLTIDGLKVGDQIAEIAGGVFLKMYTVKRKTPQSLWLTNQLRVNFEGRSLQGQRLFRIPTPADRRAHKTKQNQLDRWRRSQEEEERLKGSEEYQLARKIGFELTEGFKGKPPAYLAFVKRIGLERLRAFNDSIEESKE